MQTLKLYGAGSATANAVASVQIPSKTRIRQVQYALVFDSITDNATLNVEVSRSSAREIATNGAQQCICEIATTSNFVTSGLAQQSINGFVPCSIDVVQGQLIYLHAVVGGTVSYTAAFILHYE